MVQNKNLVHILAFVLALGLAVIASFTAFADDVYTTTVSETEVVLETEVQTSEVKEDMQRSDTELELQNVSENPVVGSIDPSDIVSVEVVRNSNPVGPDEATGLKKLLLQLIGDYDMVTAEYTYTSTSGYTNKQVTTEPDYAWMITAALFIMVLWSLFRFVGGLAVGKR